MHLLKLEGIAVSLKPPALLREVQRQRHISCEDVSA